MKPPFVPLTPSDVRALGVMDEMDCAVSPSGTYAIWHIPCFSVTDSPSKAIRQMGFAETRFDPCDTEFRLTARQRLLFEDGGRFAGACDFELGAGCRNDLLRSLRCWSLTIGFSRIDRPAPCPAWTESGRSDAGTVTIERDNHAETRACSLPLLADLGLLAVAGALPAASRHEGTVLSLDGTLMEHQWLQVAEAGDEPDVFTGTGSLRRVVRWGPGCSPWNCWVDEAGRVVMSACNSTVYLLDAGAEARCHRQAADTVYGSFSRSRA